MSVLDLKIAEIHELLNKKEITVSDLVKESLSRIKANDDNTIICATSQPESNPDDTGISSVGIHRVKGRHCDKHSY